jgi:hypothetical protein
VAALGALRGVCPALGRRGLSDEAANNRVREMDFRQMVSSEFQRQRTNPRYSLRSSVRTLGTDHSTLSQILRGKRNLSPMMVRRFGKRLGISLRTVDDACLRQQADAILRLARTPHFSNHSRWIAARTGIPLDVVNMAIENSRTTTSAASMVAFGQPRLGKMISCNCSSKWMTSTSVSKRQSLWVRRFSCRCRCFPMVTRWRY